MAKDLTKIAQNAEKYGNDSELSAVIRETANQIENNNKSIAQLNQQNKEIIEALKAKGVDVPTFKFLLSQKGKPKTQIENELESLEEISDSATKIFKTKGVIVD